MKKTVFAVFTVLCLLVPAFLYGCRNDSHTVSVDEEHERICIFDSETGKFASGDEVRFKLETVTEQYYSVFADGVEVYPDIEKSDITYTYFSFTMPDHDVSLVIEDHDVDIPLLAN